MSNISEAGQRSKLMNAPHINVTPLIDVLLVLLIIFMVVSPLKPSDFKARIPQEPTDNTKVRSNPDTLVASIQNNGTISLNKETEMGTPEDPAKLIERLRQVFIERVQNGNVSASMSDAADRPFADRIERTVFIKAPRSLRYGSVAKVVDAVKLAGAYPISLQIDDID